MLSADSCIIMELLPRWDYEYLLSESSFCLVPRGRRLGSFRFLETLESSCIPVVLANEWQMPFFEVIDWDRAAIRADERRLFQVSDALRDVDEQTKAEMRRETHRIYHQYLNSVERIIDTVLQILYRRIEWASMMPASASRSSSNDSAIHLTHDPISNFGFHKENFVVPKTFVAVIDCSEGQIDVTTLSNVISNLSYSQYLTTIVFLWPDVSTKQLLMSSITSSESLEALQVRHRFTSNTSIISASIIDKMDVNYAVYTVHHSNAKVSSLDKRFVAFQKRPWQLQGTSRALHFFNTRHNQWAFSSSPMRDKYSMIMLDDAFYHSYYSQVVVKGMKSDIRKVAHLCPHIVFNVIVTDFSNHPPLWIKPDSPKENHKRDDRSSVATFVKRQRCMKHLTDIYGQRIQLLYNSVQQ